MTAAQSPETQHPVLRFAGAVGEELEGLVDRVGFMTPEDTAAALRVLHADESAMAALKLALIAHADRVGVPAADACTSMEAWLRTELLIEPREARRQVKAAHRLEDPTVEATRVAFAAGEVSFGAVRIILEVLHALPREVEPQQRLHAQGLLLGQATQFDTADLRRLAKHLDEVINPEGAEQREADALARAQAKAERTAWCHLWFDETHQEGTGRFGIDLLTTRKLARILEALMNPGRPNPIPLRDENDNLISADERRGLALTELIDRISKSDLPTTGGCDPVVVVTMSLETLLGGTKAAILDTGERISPALARRLAAKHGVIPAVLGTKSEVLDLGRKARLASKKQRLAMSIQQHGSCAEERCDRPIAWADAHHLHPWHLGGNTDLKQMVMLCRRHHTMADHPDYDVARLAPGRIRINRRT